MSINERIKSTVGESGLTIDEYAKRIGEKPQRLKDVMRGKQKAPQEMLAGMVVNFDVDARWLLTGIIPPEHPASSPSVGEIHEARELTAQERELLNAYRRAPDELQEAALRFLDM